MERLLLILLFMSTVVGSLNANQSAIDYVVGNSHHQLFFNVQSIRIQQPETGLMAAVHVFMNRYLSLNHVLCVIIPREQMAAQWNVGRVRQPHSFIA